MSETFNACFTLLMGHEGGYVNLPNDPGGETNWGISKRSYPKVDIRRLTQEQAKAIYLRDFWTPMGCDSLPAPLALVVFDTAVNSGKGRASEFLKQTTDWRVFLALRLQFFTALGTWPDFGKGWSRRIANLLQQAAELEAAQPKGLATVFLDEMDGTTVTMTDKETVYNASRVIRYADGAVHFKRL